MSQNIYNPRLYMSNISMAHSTILHHLVMERPVIEVFVVVSCAEQHPCVDNVTVCYTTLQRCDMECHYIRNVELWSSHTKN